MEYLPVKEFAEKAGVSIQAVYKRIKADLEEYTKEEDGVKLVSLEALELYKPTLNAKRAQALEQENAALREEARALQEQIAALREEKIKLLEAQTKVQEKLFDMIERQAAIMEKHTQQQENFQVLLAQTQQLYSPLLQQQTTANNQENELNNRDKVSNEGGIKANKRGLFSFWRKREN